MLLFLHPRAVFNIREGLVHPEEHDDQLTPHSPDDIAQDEHDQSAQDAASAEISHWAIIASVAEDGQQGAEGDQNGDDDIDDLDDLEGDHAAKGDKILPIEALGCGGGCRVEALGCGSRGWDVEVDLFHGLLFWRKVGGIGGERYLYRPNDLHNRSNDPHSKTFAILFFDVGPGNPGPAGPRCVADPV